MASVNEELQDLIFEVQGRRTLNANWLAAIVDALFVDAWNKCFKGKTANPRAWKGITKDAEELIFSGNDQAFKASWMEVWKGSIDLMPKPLVTVLSVSKKLKEAIDPDEPTALDPTPIQSTTELPTIRVLPKTAPPNYKFAQALYNPPSQTEINQLNLGSEWKRFLKGGAFEKEIIQEVTKGVVNGRSTREIAKSIQSMAHRSKASATRIARTEIHRVNVAAQEHSLRSAFGKSIKSWKYTATLDSRTRPHHANQDGNEFNDDQPRPLLPDGPNCRCTYTPVTKSWNELGVPEFEGTFTGTQRASIDGQVPADQKYSNWFNKQTTVRQRSIVGNKKFDQLSKNGKVKWNSFVKSKGSPAKKRFDATIKGDRRKKGAIKRGRPIKKT
jgi:SPP1 gp7 family putative phage head morphogenesis protein